MKTATLLLTSTALVLGLNSTAFADNDKDHNKKASFAAELSGGQQVRTARIADINGTSVTIPIGPLVSGAHGDAHFSLSKDGTMLNYHFEAAGFGTPLFMAHIHLGPTGANGPIMVWLFGDQTNAPFPLLRGDDGPFTGSMSGVLTEADLDMLSADDRANLASLGVNTFADVITNIMNGNAYVNLHTTANIPGEIRGQVKSEGHHH